MRNQTQQPVVGHRVISGPPLILICSSLTPRMALSLLNSLPHHSSALSTMTQALALWEDDHKAHISSPTFLSLPFRDSHHFQVEIQILTLACEILIKLLPA